MVATLASVARTASEADSRDSQAELVERFWRTGRVRRGRGELRRCCSRRPICLSGSFATSGLDSASRDRRASRASTCAYPPCLSVEAAEYEAGVVSAEAE